MELALNEVKTKAKKLLKALKCDEKIRRDHAVLIKRITPVPLSDLQLKHCLSMIAFKLGFDNWHHAQEVLSGNVSNEFTAKFGTFFYTNACGAFINLWFSQYQEAKEALETNPEGYALMPYKSQFIVADKNYVNALKLSASAMAAIRTCNGDLVSNHNSAHWDLVAYELIRQI